jgi:hypothetical protein
LQWLQDPSEINGDNLNNVRCEASRHFRNRKGEYLQEPAMNSTNKHTSVEDEMNLRGATILEISW